MSKVYAVVDNNGILAAFPWQDEARNYLEFEKRDRDDATDRGHGEYYYTAKSNTLYVRLEDDFLSLVTLTYINRSK